MDALDEAVHPVRFWWRDDDAGRHVPALDHLLGLAARHAVPLALAVVPAWLEAATIGVIGARPLVDVLQHGWSHESRARPGERKIELGGGEDPGRLASRLIAGRERLGRAFGGRFLPVMVPPWNRIDRPVAQRLPSLGFEVLSARPDVGRPGMGDLRRLDVHLDIIDWRETRRVLPLASLAPALAATVRSCAAEPIGILSHHLVMDGDSFGVLDRLLTVIMKHPKARIVRAADLVREGR
jgi:peptidoglycan/xylan/chitin deacetylase (PgdA/CDA1 family)